MDTEDVQKLALESRSFTQEELPIINKESLLLEHQRSSVARLSSNQSQRSLAGAVRNVAGRESRQPVPPEDEIACNDEVLINVSDEEDAKEEDDFEFNEEAKEATTKRLFSLLDPAVVKGKGEAMGELGIAFKFRPSKKLLLIKLVGGSGLGSYQVSKKTINPRVVVSLRDYPEIDVKETTVKKKTSNPSWNEILYFYAEEHNIEDLRILFQVKDGFDTIGEVMVTLDWNLMEGESEWYTLQNMRDWDIKGEVDVGINYSTPSILHVKIIAAKDICGKNANNMCNSYARVTIAGKYPVYSTKLVKDSVNPTWKETFDFNVPVQLLHTVTVLVALYNKGDNKKDQFIGEIRISLRDFKHFQQIQSSFPLADLKHVARHRCEWGKDAVEQELREALVAHLVSKSPDMIFNSSTSTNRVVRLRCKKIGQASHVTFHGGKPVLEGVN